MLICFCLFLPGLTTFEHTQLCFGHLFHVISLGSWTRNIWHHDQLIWHSDNEWNLSTARSVDYPKQPEHCYYCELCRWHFNNDYISVEIWEIKQYLHDYIPLGVSEESLYFGWNCVFLIVNWSFAPTKLTALKWGNCCIEFNSVSESAVTFFTQRTGHMTLKQDSPKKSPYGPNLMYFSLFSPSTYPLQDI